jgi:Family of unknown function (DUF5681)
MPFEAGQSGNPGGRPKSAKLLRDALLVELKKSEGGVERIQLIAQKLVEAALEGNVLAIREIADRIDGKVPQAIVGDDEHDAVRVTHIIRTIVYPKNPDAEGRCAG